MDVHTSVGQLPRSSNIADFYHSSPMANEEQGPNTATALSNLATIIGSDRATEAVLTNALFESTAFTQIQAAELRRLVGADTLASSAPPIHVVKGTSTVVHGNGRDRTFEKRRTMITVGTMGTRLGKTTQVQHAPR
jgi:hypothetical protein